MSPIVEFTALLFKKKCNYGENVSVFKHGSLENRVYLGYKKRKSISLSHLLSLS